MWRNSRGRLEVDPISEALDVAFVQVRVYIRSQVILADSDLPSKHVQVIGSLVSDLLLYLINQSAYDLLWGLKTSALAFAINYWLVWYGVSIITNSVAECVHELTPSL